MVFLSRLNRDTQYCGLKPLHRTTHFMGWRQADGDGTKERGHGGQGMVGQGTKGEGRDGIAGNGRRGGWEGWGEWVSWV